MTDITLQHAVQAALDELVAGGGEVGLQAAVIKDGVLVADAQSGVTDPAIGEPVSAGSLFFAGSTAKGVLSSLVHALVAAGRLDYDLRLAEVWPEFAANGKGDVTVRHVLMHQAGVPGLPYDLTTEQLCDWHHMCGILPRRRRGGRRGPRLATTLRRSAFCLGRRFSGRPAQAWLTFFREF